MNNRHLIEDVFKKIYIKTRFQITFCLFLCIKQFTFNYIKQFCVSVAGVEEQFFPIVAFFSENLLHENSSLSPWENLPFSSFSLSFLLRFYKNQKGSKSMFVLPQVAYISFCLFFSLQTLFRIEHMYHGIHKA